MYAQSAYALPAQAINVYYGVGQAVQLRALLQQELRGDSEYQQFRAWKAAKQLKQQQYEQEQSRREYEAQQQAHTPPPAPKPEPQRKPVATVAEKCAGCHGTATPKGNYYLDGVTGMDDVSQAIENVMTGKMPPKAIDGEQLPNHVPLNALEKFQLVEDLVRLSLLGGSE